ncbi:MAG: hypothetical protein IJ722_06425 [Alloprevotella sp.]|nr:hypothetical protein [Alloprevotella sp.]
MSHSDLHFRIAGLPLRILFTDGSDARKLLNSYAPFYEPHPSDSPVMTVRFGSGLVSAEATSAEVGQFDAGGCNHGVYRLPEGGHKIIISDVSGEKVCAMTMDQRGENVHVSPLTDTFIQQEFGLNNAIMIAFAAMGAYNETLLMHSSVAMVDGRGYMFLGTSGTGKSTHSDLWVRHIPGTEILNDDNPAVVLREGKAFVCGTPWSGKRDFYRQLTLPIGAIVRLEQAPENSILREPALHAFASILSACSTMIWDKENYERICRTVEGIAMRVPIFHLKNRPDEEAARMSFGAATGSTNVETRKF